MTTKSTQRQGLSRREVITRALWATGATGVIGANSLMTAACSTTLATDIKESNTLYTNAQINWLAEVAETILPATDTPGARDAGVGPFIALMVTDTYDPQEQQRFTKGMQTLEAECVNETGVGFMQASPSQRTSLLQRIDKTQYDERQSESKPDSPHYFRAIKELTVLGYFTSEIGYTQALRYVETPGRYDPCVDYTPGEKLWARHA